MIKQIYVVTSSWVIILYPSNKLCLHHHFLLCFSIYTCMSAQCHVYSKCCSMPHTVVREGYCLMPCLWLFWNLNNAQVCFPICSRYPIFPLMCSFTCIVLSRVYHMYYVSTTLYYTRTVSSFSTDGQSIQMLYTNDSTSLCKECPFSITSQCVTYSFSELELQHKGFCAWRTPALTMPNKVGLLARNSTISIVYRSTHSLFTPCCRTAFV